VALGCEVVNLVRADLADQPRQATGVGKIAVMELDAGIGAMDEVLDPPRAEGARSAPQPVDCVSLRDEEFRR
jgi:hypothetical protein